MTRIALTLAAVLLGTSAMAQQEAAPQAGAEPAPQQQAGADMESQQAATAVASLVDAEGEANGSAELSSPAAGGVLIRIEVTGLPEDQWVAFHVHENGSCDHSSGHESAGGHFNPGSAEHGFLADGGPHAGDMPNQYVPAGGSLKAEVFNPFVTLAEGENGIRGRALMIHAKGDDHRSQPSGDAGERLACAVIE